MFHLVCLTTLHLKHPKTHFFAKQENTKYKTWQRLKVVLHKTLNNTLLCDDYYLVHMPTLVKNMSCQKYDLHRIILFVTIITLFTCQHL
jgi:hypothetical protein